MAISTKFGENVISDSLRVGQNCIFNDEIVKVWATLDGQTAEKQYWISDLIGDRKKEIRDVIHANLKKRESAN